MEFNKLAAQYQESLFRTIIPFWTQHSRDTLCGGYFNALTEGGEVFNTDKRIDLQAQQVWAFAWLYQHVDAIPQWLEMARHGADFLLTHGRGANGRWLAEVDRRGRAVALSPTVIPDCFAAMALAQLYEITEQDDLAVMAQDTIRQLLAERQQQQEEQQQLLDGIRRFKSIREPMMILKALLEARSLFEADWLKETYEAVLSEVMDQFFDKRINLLRENSLPEGGFSDSLPGRRLHPGLTFETAGYLLEAAEWSGNRRLTQQAITMGLQLAELGWDNSQGGGFFQYTDLKDRPSVYSEWDRKLWWVHSEALSLFSRGYVRTRHPECLKWFRRVHEYTWEHFPDTKNKEWFGVLDRKGQPVTSCKVTPEKGPYHLIRNLHDTWRALEQCAQSRFLSAGI